MSTSLNHNLSCFICLDWLNYKTQEFPAVETIKSRSLFLNVDDLSKQLSWDKKLPNGAEIYLMLLKSHISKSKLIYSPNKELAMFTRLDQFSLKFHWIYLLNLIIVNNKNKFVRKKLFILNCLFLLLHQNK